MATDKQPANQPDGGELGAVLRSVIQTDRRASRFFPRTRNLRQFDRSRASPVRYGIPCAGANPREMMISVPDGQRRSRLSQIDNSFKLIQINAAVFG